MILKAFINKKKFLYAPCVVLVLCFFSAPSYSQDSKAPNQKLEKIVRKNFQRAKNALNRQENKIKGDVGSWLKTQNKKDGIEGIEGPENNPLDSLGGHLDPKRSEIEYTGDSKILLNDETFPQCLEPRLVAESSGGRADNYVDQANRGLALWCEMNCHAFDTPILWINPHPQQQWKVLSYYWPEYQISINKSGAQMIDPDIVKEGRGNNELYRQPTAQAEESDNERGQSAQLDLLKKMGLPTELFKDPKWHKAGKETQLQADGEIRYASSMRTNLDAQAAHKRPAWDLGWERADSCLFNALNVKTDKKKVIHNRYDQGIYAIAARYPETRKEIDPKRYKYTSPSAMKLSDYKNDTPKEFRESLCASWRMGSNPSVYGDLSKVGFQAINDPTYKTYCLPGGGDLSGSMEATENTPRLQADAVRAVMSAVYFGNNKLSKLQKMNKDTLRPNWFTLYEKRASSAVPRYVGAGYKQVDFNPGENKSNVVFVDKLQRIYPTQPIGSGNVDGVGGASSAGYRVTEGQRGSHCFRPEDIPNWSSEGRTNVSEWPLGLMQDVRKNFGESRWAVWNRRVVCACQVGPSRLGIQGCLSLNSGDKEEAGFLGIKPYMGEMPPPFKKAIPVLRDLAGKKPPASGGAPAFGGFDFPIVDIGPLGAGLSAPNMPGGKQPPPDQGPDADALLQLICIPLGNQQNGSGQTCSGGSCSAGGNNNGGTGTNSGGLPTGGSCPGGQCGAGGAGIGTGAGTGAGTGGGIFNGGGFDVGANLGLGSSLPGAGGKSQRNIKVKEFLNNGSYILESNDPSKSKTFTLCSKDSSSKYSCNFESADLLRVRQKG